MSILITRAAHSWEQRKSTNKLENHLLSYPIVEFCFTKCVFKIVAPSISQYNLFQKCITFHKFIFDFHNFQYYRRQTMTFSPGRSFLSFTRATQSCKQQKSTVNPENHLLRYAIVEFYFIKCIFTNIVATSICQNHFFNKIKIKPFSKFNNNFQKHQISQKTTYGFQSCSIIFEFHSCYALVKTTRINGQSWKPFAELCNSWILLYQVHLH